MISKTTSIALPTIVPHHTTHSFHGASSRRCRLLLDSDRCQPPPPLSLTTSPVPSDCISSSKVAVRLVLAHPDLARHILRLWRGDRRREILEPVGNVGTRRIHRRLRLRRLREQRPGALRRLAAIPELVPWALRRSSSLGSVESFTSARPTDEEAWPFSILSSSPAAKVPLARRPASATASASRRAAS